MTKSADAATISGQRTKGAGEKVMDMMRRSGWRQRHWLVFGLVLIGLWSSAAASKAQSATPTPILQATVTPSARRLLVPTATPALTTTVTFTGTLLTQPVRTRLAPPATLAPTRVTGARAVRNANLRAGPGTNYAIVGSVQRADQLDLVGRTGDGSWYQLRDGRWIAAFLVQQGDAPLPTVAPTVIAGLPTLAPTATPIALPSATAVASRNDDPPPVATVAPAAGTTTFVVTRRRLWNPWENGGSTDGPSVHCGQGRNLSVNVLDENGNRLNGVAVQVEYGAKEIYVTGAQGKGDGIVEFVLGSGQDVRVVRDADGTAVNSEVARGLSTDPRGIDQESLIGAGYCQDGESCRTFVNNLSCIGHFSWTVTFERRR